MMASWAETDGNAAGRIHERIITAPATPALKAYVDELLERAEKIKSRSVDPSVDNMLKITGDGRKAALDMRLIQ